MRCSPQYNEANPPPTSQLTRLKYTPVELTETIVNCQAIPMSPVLLRMKCVVTNVSPDSLLLPDLLHSRPRKTIKVETRVSDDMEVPLFYGAVCGIYTGPNGKEVAAKQWFVDLARICTQGNAMLRDKKTGVLFPTQPLITQRKRCREREGVSRNDKANDGCNDGSANMCSETSRSRRIVVLHNPLHRYQLVALRTEEISRNS
ncbi:hypothetical protein, conserved [Trypanosoma brucei gambiense DAL972]|uniref:Uncharacterized protein n=1 Tax=Trypanosoma brucei gambiense (strain MHOM/CI/86/DAL972) TaxID=679716 RepID=C9ZLD8_TRYB9|nr:hypothetical protein, conserved [Trypanosoma brucei gambiense DAL972]CBH10147.1 hypothetical protein, conserved [Trypanosoma brucei gambiense DAL972]|eukprot:XP_011772437.1 hypothetical protein, conserved [Trypanosoma brucei gambiense DAL972]